MERASRILGKLQIKPVEVAGVKSYHLAPGAWAAAVGKKIASHTRPTFLQNGTLTVEVEDAVVCADRVTRVTGGPTPADLHVN